jgi:hypothetical protein
MDELIAFLRKEIALDERIALAVQDNSAPFDGQWKVDGEALRTYNDWVLAYRQDGKPFRPGVLDHIAHFDPARQLREVKAKRAIIDGCIEVIGRRDLARYGEFGLLKDDPDALAVTLAVDTLHLLAVPYADQPDYRKKWRP